MSSVSVLREKTVFFVFGSSISMAATKENDQQNDVNSEKNGKKHQVKCFHKDSPTCTGLAAVGMRNLGQVPKPDHSLHRVNSALAGFEVDSSQHLPQQAHAEQLHSRQYQ